MHPVQLRKEIRQEKRDSVKAPIQVRNFAPRFGIDEESATGTSNCALASLLGAGTAQATRWTFSQGALMGMPSCIEVALGGSPGSGEPAVAPEVGGRFRFAAAAQLSLDVPPRHHQRIVDAHVHIWRREGAIVPPPDHLAERGSTSALLRHMADSKVDHAIIVQPSVFGDDHSYVLAAMRQHPHKIKGIALFNPHGARPDMVHETVQRFASDGFVGLRVNVGMWPGGSLDCRTADDLWAAAGMCGLPLGVMCFQGLHKHVGQLQELATRHHATRIVIDHCGFFLQVRPRETERRPYLTAGRLAAARSRIRAGCRVIFRTPRHP